MTMEGNIMSTEKVIRYECDCGMRLEISEIAGAADVVYRLLAHGKGWFVGEKATYCPEHIPQELRLQEKHPISYSTCGQRIEFIHEKFDPFYNGIVNYELCKCCKRMKLGVEGDGSTWMTCTAGGSRNDPWGHNLYEGHFYGSAVKGRLCPYWGCNAYDPSRDDGKDKENGCFQRPYDDLYD